MYLYLFVVIDQLYVQENECLFYEFTQEKICKILYVTRKRFSFCIEIIVFVVRIKVTINLKL